MPMLKLSEISLASSLFLVLTFLCQNVRGRSLSLRQTSTLNLGFEEDDIVIVRPKLRELNRRSSRSIDATEKVFNEIENPETGYKWSNRETQGLSLINAVVDFQQNWIICKRDGYVMLGLSPSRWNGNTYHFAGKFGSMIRLDSDLRPCHIDPDEVDLRTRFRFIYNSIGRLHLIQHIHSEQYVKLTILSDLRGELSFTNNPEKATEWRHNDIWKWFLIAVF